MYDRSYSASLIIASKGNEKPEVGTTVFGGEIRSRNGANLKYTTNDGKEIFQSWSKDNSVPPEAHLFLVDPSLSDVEEAIYKINKLLSEYPQEKTGIDIFYAGHGEFPTGALVLKDHNFTVNELISLIAQPLNPNKGERGLGLILDSCYAGSFLIDLVVELENNEFGIKLYDAKASSMYNEKSFELPFLEHGVFTFTFLHPGNSYIQKHELTRAIETLKIDKKSIGVIVRCLQGMVGMVSSPVAFLTKAQQHSIDCIKGTHFTVEGYGGFSLHEIEGKITREILIDNFEKAKAEIWK